MCTRNGRCADCAEAGELAGDLDLALPERGRVLGIAAEVTGQDDRVEFRALEEHRGGGGKAREVLVVDEVERVGGRRARRQRRRERLGELVRDGRELEPVGDGQVGRQR